VIDNIDWAERRVALRADPSVLSHYDHLLAAIGDRSDEIGERPVVTHWPHVGSAYQGLVIVGQAVYGWADDCRARELRSPDFRTTMIASIQSRVDKPEPLDWIESHRVRSSPFWRSVRRFVDALDPRTDAPWYAKFAWVNLYPSAPEEPPGNPGGALLEAQVPLVGGLLRSVTDALVATRAIALVGPYWWAAAPGAGLANLAERNRPLLRAGRADGTTWVVGWHPNGASHRGFGPAAYTQIVAEAVESLETRS